MLPSHPLFCRFENELVVTNQTLEWTMRRNDFFFRPTQSDLGILWCELNRREMVECFNNPEQTRRTQKRIAKNLQKHRIWRFWPLSNERELVFNLDFALMRAQGAALWLRLEWLKPFFQDGEDLLFRRGDELAEIEKFLQNSDEDWNWLASSFGQSQAAWSWFDCNRGSIRELQKLLEAYILLTGSHVNYYGVGQLGFSSILHASQQSPAPVWNSTRRFAQLLDSEFSLRLQSFVPRIYDASGALKKPPTLFLYRASEPTTHEKLEAHLLLKNWLRGKISESEIKSLLPKL